MKDELTQWMLFLDNPNSMEVEKIMSENKDIKEAVETLEEISQDEKLRRLTELREKAIRDEKIMKRTALEEGLAEGREKGMTEGRTIGIAEALERTAKKMLEKGIAIKEISEITDLSEEKIKELKNID